MKTSNRTRVGRRDFLCALGASAGTAAAMGSLTTGARADTETNEEKRKARYLETEHVKTFYRVNKYPAKR
jgi:hypothetical protein